MTEEQDPNKDKVSHERFEIGSVGNPQDPDVLIISFPVKFYAKRGPDGLDEAVGKCRRIESYVSMLIKNHFQLKAKAENKLSRGIIGADGKPVVIS